MSAPHERLDAAMAQRRLNLGLKTWRDLAQAAGISYETLRALRKGEGTPAEATIHGLDRALQWQPGSLQRVLDGKDPMPIEAAPPGREAVDIADEEDSSITPQLRALLEQAQHRTDERLEELTKKVDEQNELIKRLLSNKRGA